MYHHDYALLRRKERDHFLRNSVTPFSHVSTYRQRARRAADKHERRFWLGLARAAIDLQRERRIAKAKARQANAVGGFLGRVLVKANPVVEEMV